MPKISQLPPGTALTGPEMIPDVQSGVTVRTTPSAVAAYVFNVAGTIIGKIYRAIGGSAAIPSYSFDDDTTTGGYLVSAGTPALSVSGVERARATSSQISTSIPVDVGSSRTITMSGAQSATQKGFRATYSYKGSTTSLIPALNDVFINSFSVSGTSSTLFDLFRVHANVGVGQVGAIDGIHSTIFVNGLTGNKAAGAPGFFVGGEFTVSANANQGGTDLTPSGSFGGAFGGNDNAILQSGATYWQQLIGREINVSVHNGASVNRKIALQIVKTSTDRVAGIIDTAVAMTDQVGAPAWKRGVLFGLELSQWPFDATSTLIGGVLGQNYTTVNSLANWGVDFLPVTFSGGFLRSNGFSVSGDGTTQVGTSYLKPDSSGLIIDASGSIGSISSVAAGGSGFAVNDLLTDAYGGIYQVSTVSAGAITGMTLRRSPIIDGSTPANPVALTADIRHTGSGATVNLTWSAQDGVTINSSGGAIGFYGAAPAAKPTITGSRGGNAALASLLTKLATLGLITNGTTA